MDFTNSLAGLSVKVAQQASAIQTEEATKNAFVMPFIHSVLGYDVFDPSEVIPEYVCDVGTKKGEKIDYAILKGGEVQILIECKKIGEPLSINHASQLFRYFHVTSARVAILTNGRFYSFFTDLDAPNKMDEKPFMELDLLDVDEHVIPELVKLTKAAFDVESIVNAAGELKYVSRIKKLLTGLLNSPDEDFVRFVATRVYDGTITQKVRELFSELTRKAAVQFLNDQANDRLKSAIVGPGSVAAPAIEVVQSTLSQAEDSLEKVVTTEEEREGFMVVRAILRSVVDVKRIVMRDNQSYCAILLDDNNRKTICRLHFNRAQKYLGLLDQSRAELRIPIDGVDDIYANSEGLIESVKLFEAQGAAV
ncbi:restriction endonuclease or methylase [Stenotrophomonas humi]|uniref:Restriction endonuclease or methylase n=1 Tax=Stenotrophomonas humi TaxID=405444 RepID=A0A0R0CKY9_9GAMM|nr:type I restriction enzyme HsdR N-terminal domain-containing protein [Stenotrophomonas humi]KRG65560.1 restriction endonuclease or methylase [Stenotrophomonas humi]